MGRPGRGRFATAPACPYFSTPSVGTALLGFGPSRMYAYVRQLVPADRPD
jgi:hypothetical protein